MLCNNMTKIRPKSFDPVGMERVPKCGAGRLIDVPSTKFHVRFTVHGSLSAVTHAPFMRQCRGLPHRLAQCLRTQGWEVVN